MTFDNSLNLHTGNGAVYFVKTAGFGERHSAIVPANGVDYNDMNMFACLRNGKVLLTLNLQNKIKQKCNPYPNLNPTMYSKPQLP